MELTIIITSHSKPVIGGLRRNEPGIHFITDSIPIIGWDLPLGGKVLVGWSPGIHPTPIETGVIPKLSSNTI